MRTVLAIALSLALLHCGGKVVVDGESSSSGGGAPADVDPGTCSAPVCTMDEAGCGCSAECEEQQYFVSCARDVTGADFGCTCSANGTIVGPCTDTVGTCGITSGCCSELFFD